MAIIGIQLGGIESISATAFLQDGNVILNTGGDTLTHVGNGYMTFDLTESRVSGVDYYCRIEDSGGTNLIFDYWLFAGESEVGHVPSKVTLQTATQDSIDAIEAVTDQFVFSIANQVDANALTGGGDDATTIYTHFVSGSNEDVFKADISGLATPANITDAQTAIISEIDANEAKLDTLLGRVTSSVATLWANMIAMITGSGGTAAFTTTALENAPAGGGVGDCDSKEDIYAYFTSNNNEDVFKADIMNQPITFVARYNPVSGWLILWQNEDYSEDSAAGSIEIPIREADEYEIGDAVKLAIQVCNKPCIYLDGQIIDKSGVKYARFEGSVSTYGQGTYIIWHTDDVGNYTIAVDGDIQIHRTVCPAPE